MHIFKAYATEVVLYTFPLSCFYIFFILNNILIIFYENVLHKSKLFLDNLSNFYDHFSFTDVSNDGVYLSVLFNRDFDLMKSAGIFINPVQLGIDAEIFRDGKEKFSGAFVRVNYYTYKTAINVGSSREEKWEDVCNIERLQEIANEFLDEDDEEYADANDDI